MIHLISPAKSLDFESKAKYDIHTEVIFKNEAEKIMKKLKSFSKNKLKTMMKISDSLAELNFNRNQQWELPLFENQNTKQAIYAFSGDVYVGLKANTFSKKDIEYAQQHLRILSGLHGLLKPLDLIMPYRLEMGTVLKIGRNKNLYEFWNQRICKEINIELKQHKTKLILNLASNEYIKAVDKKMLDVDIITPIFKDGKNGKFKVISFFAKKARGMMSNYIIKNKINTIDDLKGFDDEGYVYDSSLSKSNELVFCRAENWAAVS